MKNKKENEPQPIPREWEFDNDVLITSVQTSFAGDKARLILSINSIYSKAASEGITYLVSLPRVGEILKLGNGEEFMVIGKDINYYPHDITVRHMNDDKLTAQKFPTPPFKATIFKTQIA